MNTDPGQVEELLATRLNEAASEVDASQDLLTGVQRRHRILRRRRLGARVGSVGIAVLVAVGLGWATRPNSSSDTLVAADADPSTDESSASGSSLVQLTECLQQSGLPVEADGDFLAFVGPPASVERFEAAYVSCTEQLSTHGTVDETQLRTEALALYEQAVLRFELETERRLAEEAARREAERVEAFETERAMREAEQRVEGEVGMEQAPTRYVLEGDGSVIVVTDVIDRDGGVVSIEFTLVEFPETALNLHVVPGQFAEPPADFDPEPIEVRGREGTTTRPPDGSLSVLWQEHPDLAMELSAHPTVEAAVLPTAQDLVLLANQVVEVNEADWESYRERHP